MVREGPDLYRAPTDLLDDARVPLSAHRDHVANLERPVCLQRNSREEIAEGVLKRKSEDHAEDRRRREERAKIDLRKNERERDQKQDRERDDGEDVATERRRVDSFELVCETEK